MNVALRLVRFRVPAMLVNPVGKDDLGYDLLNCIESQGVVTEHIQVEEQYPTGQVKVDVSNSREVRYC